MKRVIGFLNVLVLLFAVPALAQDLEGDEVRSEISMLWGIPQGSFDDNIDETGLGATFFIGGRVPGLPVVLGSEGGFLIFGSDNFVELVDLYVPVSAVNVRTDNNIFMGHLVGRLQPQFGPVAPYVDALLGVRYFSGKTKIASDFVVHDEDGLYLLSSFDDIAFSYGAGGGLEFQVYTGPMGIEDRSATVSMNVGVRYLFGSKAEYLDMDSIQRVGGRTTFNTHRSRTDMLIPQFGFRVSM